MNRDFSELTLSGIKSRVERWTRAAAMISFAVFAVSAAAQTNPFSPYIPNAVPTATTTLYSGGTTTISPGRVGVDRAGNVFYINHAGASAGTLYEIPAASPAVTITAPTPIISGLGLLNSNSAFVDASGTLWLANGNGSGGALFEIPAANGIPNIAAIKASSSYTSTGLPLSTITTACTATSTAACTWSASSISSTFTGLQVGDVYSDGAGNVYLVDLGDNVSNGSYNRVIQFNTSKPGTANVLADKLTTNTYAQVTVAGDGNVYYCDSITGNTKGGATYLVSGGIITLVENTSNSSLTLLNGIVKVTSATGITVDPWGDLIISGAKQISEVPIEQGGALNFLDQFNLLVAVTGSNSPVYTNNVIYGGSIDVHGNYYFASNTNVMLTEVGGHNFGTVNVGTEVTTAAPYVDITWDIPTQLLQSGAFPTSSPSGLSAANAGLLQSFPNGNSKNFFGGTPYSAATTGSYLLMYFQPVHPGLLRGADAPQGYPNALAASDPGGSTLGATEYGGTPAYTVSLQGVGVGPQPMFLPGTPSTAIALPQLYTSQTHTTKAVGFTPTAIAVDTYGDIFATDSTNSSVDLDCLATTNNAATALASFCQANGYGYTYKVNYTLNKTLTPVSFVNPADVVLDGANSAYVLDSGVNTPILVKLPYETMIPSIAIPSGTIVAGTAIFKPQGLAIDGYANVYIADTGNNRILQARTNNAQYAQTNVYVPTTTLFGGNMLNGPTGMGLDAAGDLFIADTGNRRIVEYSATGVPSVISTPGVTLVSPTSVKVLPSGALVIADSSLGLVLLNNGAASVLSTGSIKLQSTGGLSLDLSGNIYVADPVGGQVVELKVSAPGSASFPATLKPDSTGSHTSTETSYIYNDGNATLNITGNPVVTDNTSSATNEFSVDSTNACTASTSLAPSANCSLVLDFTPSSTAVVYTTVTGVANIADNILAYTVIANPAFGSGAIGSFSATGGSQNVNLSGMPVVPFTPQTITFPAINPIPYTTPIPPISLSATGGATGNPVVFSIVSGPGTLSGTNNSTLTLTNVGTTVIAANQAGGLVNGVYYSAAPTVTQSVVVTPIGTVATPTFSVAAGTYTAVQSVTISDATAGATIYYTTNGNNPTISSPVYTGVAIPVTITTTIKAIAVGAPGYANSAIATATYILNPDFTLTPYVTNFTIPNGLGGSGTITITPLFGFTGEVVLGCSGLSGKDSCSFLDHNGNPATQLAVNSTTLINGSVYGTMIIQANETAELMYPGARPFAIPGAVLATLFLFGGLRKRKRLATLMLLLVGALGASLMTGCSEVTLTGTTHTSTFTLTATSGSVTHSQTITLNVDNLGN
jgi:hypothetical protein